MTEIRACAVDELVDGEMLSVPDAPLPLAVCRVDGQLLAFENNCSHEDFELSEGMIDGMEVECPLHGARFCLRTGAARAAPASSGIRVFSARESNGEVLVDLSGLLSGAANA